MSDGAWGTREGSEINGRRDPFPVPIPANPCRTQREGVEGPFESGEASQGDFLFLTVGVHIFTVALEDRHRPLPVQGLQPRP